MTTNTPLIIVVDDDFDDLEIIKHILETSGYRVLGFLHAMEALEQMAIEKPALVITDLMMKSIDSGFSFARVIKFDHRFKDVPVILITAAVSKQKFAIHLRNLKDLEMMGIDAFFDKPVAPEELLAKVRELLVSHSEEN